VNRVVLKMKSIKDIISYQKENNPITLRRLVKNNSVVKVETHVAMLLVGTLQAIGKLSLMSQENIEETAMYIVNDNPDLTIVDINFIFKKIKTGQVGELYGDINMNKVCGWFSIYENEKSMSFAKDSRSISDSYKHNGNRSSKEENFRDMVYITQEDISIVNSKSLNRKK